MVADRDRVPDPMMLLAALDAFYQEHRRCGDLDGDVDGERVWMVCAGCGARLALPLAVN